MVTTTPVAPSSAAATASAANSTAASHLAGNFDEFLQLLTTQLKNQDPTSPLDPNQFTQELVQFSSVEQQIQTNTSLTTLISLQQNAQATAALGFIGHTVVINGSAAQLSVNRLSRPGPGLRCRPACPASCRACRPGPWSCPWAGGRGHSIPCR